ncbi:MAG: basic amino acid/polyamine antiporter, family, partial [Gaiellaceae bacterium]|nr:basic amino acid/polyamine antiporter, family [Gaiellaceae bacterium]
LAVAGAIAYCNATSSARLAAIYPESGGTYVYARRELGAFWGYLAGMCFVAGKLASCAAMALTFAHYTAPGLARPLAVGAVVALSAVNIGGVEKTARLTAAIVAVVLAGLAAFVAAALLGGAVSADNVLDGGHGGVLSVLRSAGSLFFAFAGYARIATLGEEVRDPERTIPRAIPIALAVTLVVYAVVALAALLAAGPDVLSASAAPLRAVLAHGSHSELQPIVQVAAAVASLGVLLSLLAGVSRTVFAMAANRELPGLLAAVHPRTRVPHRAEVAVGLAVAAVVAIADVRSAIGFSSFCVLVYYALANASALALGSGARRHAAVAVGGLVGCLVVAVTLPAESVVGGMAVVVASALLFAARARTSGGSRSSGGSV